MNSCIILCTAVILILRGNVTFDNHKLVYNIMYCCQYHSDRQCDIIIYFTTWLILQGFTV